MIQKEMYRREFIDYVHNDPEGIIEATGLLQRDRQGNGWICPICGNGSGEDGDGLASKIGKKGFRIYSCFRENCSLKARDLFGIIEEWQGMDFDGAIHLLADALNITLKNDIGYQRSSNSNSKVDYKKLPAPKNQEKNQVLEVQKEKKSEANTNTNKNEAPDEVKKSVDNTIKDPNKLQKQVKEGGSSVNSEAFKAIQARGITKNNPLMKYVSFNEHEAVFHNSLDSRIHWNLFNKNYYKEKDRPDIPFGLIEVLKHKDKKLFEDASIANLLEPVFITEGNFDALSIAEAGYDAISTNSTSNVIKTINYLQNEGVKRPLIICLDNDKAGNDTTKDIYEAFKENVVYYNHGFNTEAKQIKPGEDLQIYIPTSVPISEGDPNDYLRQDEEGLYSYLDFIVSKTTEYAEDFYIKTSILKDRVKLDGDETVNRFKKYARQRKISTSFDSVDMDLCLGGGLSTGLYVLGAGSSEGKTTFSLQLGEQIAASNYDVLFFSLEMERTEIEARCVSRYMFNDHIKKYEEQTGKKIRDASIKDIRSISLEAENKTFKYGKPLTYDEVFNCLDIDERNLWAYSEEDKIYYQYVTCNIGKWQQAISGKLSIIEAPTVKNPMNNPKAMDTGVNVDMIWNYVKDYIDITGRYPVVFVDYLQLLDVPLGYENDHLTETEKTIKNIRRLKKLSRYFRIPVFVISSFNRASYKSIGSMESFKETGDIEYTSDVLLSLDFIEKFELKSTKEDENIDTEEVAKEIKEMAEASKTVNGYKPVVLSVLKNRNGMKGSRILFSYYYYYNTFIEGSKIPERLLRPYHAQNINFYDINHKNVEHSTIWGPMKESLERLASKRDRDKKIQKKIESRKPTRRGFKQVDTKAQAVSEATDNNY